MNKLLTTFFLSAALCCGAQAQNKEKFYEKHLEFPANATAEQKIDMASRLVPTAQQMTWQQFELSAFLHFGINTFTSREWGDGKEDPALFNPVDLDAEQWVRTLKDAGFKIVILTAKHHDGFCLWPSKYTKHSVASSPWKGGKGDVVRELRDACTKYDMKFGVYLSPWDRNNESYGDSPRYNQYFINQLTELLTNYGEVHEVWFDGACGEGPNGKKQVYDWDAFYATIHRLQPNAVTAIMGDDVRWVGNEDGVGRKTEWSATVLTPEAYTRAAENNKALGIHTMAQDIGSREQIAKAKEMFWYPSEVDVSIRPGWFYHEWEDAKVKSLKHLSDIYFESVGYNSVLLLNIPPNNRGLIADQDVKRLLEFAEYRKKTFDANFVTGGSKMWKAPQGAKQTYSLGGKKKINVVMLQEDIARGQRVESFTVEALTEYGWKHLATATTVGYKRMVRFDDVETTELRITINGCRNVAYINNVGAFYAEPLQHVVYNGVWNNVPRSEWTVLSTSPFTVDIGRTLPLETFTYAPKDGKAKPTMAFRYKLLVSTDGEAWQEVKTTGEFSNIMHNPQPQTIILPGGTKARYIKLEATTPTDTPAIVEAEEIGVIR